jgi:hypothetical protein
VALLVNQAADQVIRGWFVVVPVEEGKEDLDVEFAPHLIQCFDNRKIPPAKPIRRRELVLVVLVVEPVVKMARVP